MNDFSGNRPRVRVPAGQRTVAGEPGSGIAPASANGSFGASRYSPGGYLRDSRSGVIMSRPATLRHHHEDVRRSWVRAAALAMDLIQNSGRLRGVCDQILADTIGTELHLNYKPNLTAFGYDSKEAADFIKTVKELFRIWSFNPAECDIRGKWTLHQQADIGMRHWLGTGEGLGIIDFMTKATRRRYGIKTGVKYSVISSQRLVQDTNASQRLFQGVFHDENARPISYRVESSSGLFSERRDYPARDRAGRQLFVHAFDPVTTEDVRGFPVLASTFRKYLMGENFEESHAQLAFLQTIYAITLTSERPSAEAFEALQTLAESGNSSAGALGSDYFDYFQNQLDKAAEGEIRIGDDPQLSHLVPGENLDFKQLTAPGSNFSPFIAEIHRETARALSISYGGYTMDYTQATYASTNMENAALHPVAVRRTERIAAPHILVPFQNWLDEQIGEGWIPFKGGYEAFAPNREALTWATCIGPSKPTADDEKRARAMSEELLNGTATLEDQCAALGRDPEEVFESRQYWHQRYKDADMPSPFERKMGSAPAQDGKDNKAKAA